MFEIRLAEKPFKYNGVEYSDYYNYFVLIVDGIYAGILEFDLMSERLKKIELDDPTQFYDAFIRSALHYFMQKKFEKITLSGQDFEAFKRNYLLNGVFDGDQILLDPFFDIGCGCNQ